MLKSDTRGAIDRYYTDQWLFLNIDFRAENSRILRGKGKEVSMNPVHLGAGWLKLVASSQDLGELDVLKFRTASSQYGFDQQIHVPVDARGLEGRLMYTIPGAYRIGDSDPLGAGCIIPCDGGIKIVSPDDPKKNRLFLSDIQKLIARRTFVILRFFVEN